MSAVCGRENGAPRDPDCVALRRGVYEAAQRGARVGEMTELALRTADGGGGSARYRESVAGPMACRRMAGVPVLSLIVRGLSDLEPRFALVFPCAC
jgi:hypothetical protein